MSASMGGLRRRDWRWGFCAFGSFFLGAIALVPAVRVGEMFMVKTVTLVKSGASRR